VVGAATPPVAHRARGSAQPGARLRAGGHRGRGSPAEINLRASDIVNMRVAHECQADVYLVADIDRGGAFAHLLGTWHCLEPAEQALVKGFILNKFRGDRTLLGTLWTG